MGSFASNVNRPATCRGVRDRRRSARTRASRVRLRSSCGSAAVSAGWPPADPQPPAGRPDRSDYVVDLQQGIVGGAHHRDDVIATVTEPDLRRRRRLDAAFDTLETAARHVLPLRAVPEVTDGASAAARAGMAGRPDLDVARLQRRCAARVPEGARHQVYVECQRAAGHLTIVERRAPWSPDMGPEWTSSPIAQLRYDHPAQTWTLFGRDRNMRFHTYDRLPAAPHIDVLLTEIGADPTGIFWG